MARPSGSTESRTRHQILDLLKARGECSARELAELLGITATAVRQHLQQLSREDLIQERQESQGRGRPVGWWSLTLTANEWFPDSHASLAVDLLGSLSSTFGKEGLERLIDQRTRQQAEVYKEQLGKARSLGQRVKILARLRSKEGYMAVAEKGSGRSWLLIERHCPICSAARTCLGLCAGELKLFELALGKGVRIERKEHLLSGDRRCLYQILPM